MDTIHIACCFDDEMAAPAAVLAASVAAAMPEADVTFHMVHGNGLKFDITALQAALNSERFRIAGLPVTEDLSGLHRTPAFSEAVYYRFLLPDLIAAARVIYLDCDTMVRRSLVPLYHLEMAGRPVAAMQDFTLTHHLASHDMPLSHRGETVMVADYAARVLGLDLATTEYFNTGVLVMDLAAWRRLGLGRHCLAFCRAAGELVMVDQDAANAVIKGNFAPLDARWNAFSYLYREYYPPAGPRPRQIFGGHEEHFRAPTGNWREVLTAWAFDPWIVHFSFRSKPWRADDRRTDYDAEFWAHAARTPTGAALRRQFMSSRRAAWPRQVLSRLSRCFPFRYLRPFLLRILAERSRKRAASSAPAAATGWNGRA
jgi:lipopolysaccharide biosynthesis glycosyltransferase